MALAKVVIDGQCRSFPICKYVLRDLVAEIFSNLNQHGTRLQFSTAHPTLLELVDNYHDSGGFQRFLDRNLISL